MAVCTTHALAAAVGVSEARQSALTAVDGRLLPQTAYRYRSCKLLSPTRLALDMCDAHLDIVSFPCICPLCFLCLFTGSLGFGMDPSVLEAIAAEIKAARAHGIQIAVVVGGGNYFRGASAWAGLERATADYVGMLATVMNALCLQVCAEILSAVLHGSYASCRVSGHTCVRYACAPKQQLWLYHVVNLSAVFALHLAALSTHTPVLAGDACFAAASSPKRIGLAVVVSTHCPQPSVM